MAKLPVPTGDSGSLFEAFDPNRNNLSGEIATITLKLGSGSLAREDREKLQSILVDPGFESATLEAAEERLKKGLGSGYEIFYAEFDESSLEIRVTVATLFDETSSPEMTAKGVAKVTADFSNDVGKILAEKFDAPTKVLAEWEPEKGLTTPMRFSASDTPVSALEERRTYLRWQRNRIASLRNWILAASCVTIAVLILVIGVRIHGTGLTVVSLYVGLIAAAAIVANRMMASRIGEFDDDIREAGNELDLRRIETDQGEARAQKLFQSHAFEIKRYYDQALRQGRSIYYVGIVCIGLGFAVIGAAFALVSSADSKDLSGQIIVGALGSIGAILANFIAVVYLKMFSETVQALTGFHQRLVITHHLHFGNFLASKIKDKKTRETALAEMSMGLSAPSRVDVAGVPASSNGAAADGAKP
jgi:hypothetical protein